MEVSNNMNIIFTSVVTNKTVVINHNTNSGQMTSKQLHGLIATKEVRLALRFNSFFTLFFNSFFTLFFNSFFTLFFNSFFTLFSYIGNRFEFDEDPHQWQVCGHRL